MMLLPDAASAADRYLRFDGVPMKGDAMAFVNRLRRKGWTAIEAGDHVVTMKGTWIDLEGVTAVIVEDAGGKALTDVGALVPCQVSWVDMQATWMYIVETLSRSWGEPGQMERRFRGTAPAGDPQKLLAVQEGRCDWHADWTLDGGTATVKMVFLGSQFQVMVTMSVRPATE